MDGSPTAGQPQPLCFDAAAGPEAGGECYEGQATARRIDPIDGRYAEFVFALGWWQQCRQGRVGPRRREIDPAELGRILPRVSLVEFDSARDSFRYRLAGTGLHRLHRRDIAYTLVADMRPAAYRDLLLAQYRESMASGAPVAYDISFTGADRIRRRYACLRLPLSDDGLTPNGLLTVDGYDADWPRPGLREGLL